MRSGLEMNQCEQLFPDDALLFAWKAGAWFRRVRLVMVCPVRRRTSPRSGRNSTYRTVQIFQATSQPSLTNWPRGSETYGPIKSNPPRRRRDAYEDHRVADMRIMAGKLRRSVAESHS